MRKTGSRILACSFITAVVMLHTTAWAQSLREPDAPVKKIIPHNAASIILNASVASVDRRYERDTFPDLQETKNCSFTAWRGERVHGQFVIWTGTGLKDVTLSTTDLMSTSGAMISAKCVVPFYVRYTLGKEQLQGDILEPAKPIDIPAASTRPIWLSINVPVDAVPGTYSGQLQVKDASDHSVHFNLKVEVLSQVLPGPKDWTFHLDLWQHPWAIARIHGLKPWSPDHWAKLKDVLTLVANAGQKCLTTTIVDRPWGQQTYDAFDTMVRPTRRTDGTWTYDYSLFDKYVEFGFKCGISQQINCYSMVPFGNNLYYQDEASGEYKKITAKPGTAVYDDYWSPFLKDFTTHLKKKGWFDITTIAMDERHLEDMNSMIALIDSVSPDFKITLAANKNLTSIIDRVHDYCFFSGFKPDTVLNLKRAEQGKQTTTYVCCVPKRPNTFTFSLPAESTWLGWYAASKRYTGLLRWALCSYTEDPLRTTDYPRRSWPTGDCFLIYPGPRSSIRFERLREGIQDYEKIRVLRETFEKQGEYGKAHLASLNAILQTIKNSDHTKVVNNAKTALTELARKITIQEIEQENPPEKK
ncbi:DUF4091 domain-containing protein [candidate division KSB1 bacterium]|nr:DUF4091 domain-containing protein [candidate division KSB1 bacterium]